AASSAHSSAARRAVRPPLTRLRLLVGEIIKHRSKGVRVVGDEERAIVDALNALRHCFIYTFTTGGIGLTHGDITADYMAKAFSVPIDSDPRALAILHEWVKTTGAEMNGARLRLTRIPKSADRARGGLASGAAM